MQRNAHYFSDHNGLGLKSPQHIVRPCGAGLGLKSPQRICTARATPLRLWLKSPQRIAHPNDSDRGEGTFRCGYCRHRRGRFPPGRYVDCNASTIFKSGNHLRRTRIAGAYTVRPAALNAADRPSFRGGREGTAQAVFSTRGIDRSPRVPPQMQISESAVPNREGLRFRPHRRHRRGAH